MPRGLFGRDRVFAVDGVSLALHPGEVLGLVGESGCGKSTLARMLAGLQQPTSGILRHRGVDLASMPANARRKTFTRDLAIVFQDPSSSLNPRWTVNRIVRDPLDIHRIGSARSRQERVGELLTLVGLPESVGPRLPSQMSIGQRQRVAIARALALQPSVLIADEPTSALDVSVKAQILNLLVDLRVTLKLGVVLISHDILAVRYLADRIAVMYLGHILEEGPAADVCATPRHPYTASLLSATPRLDRPATGERIVLRGTVPDPRNPPSGCPFRTRCWLATVECAAALPAPRGERHRVSCLHPLNDADHPRTQTQ